MKERVPTKSRSRAARRSSGDVKRIAFFSHGADDALAELRVVGPAREQKLKIIQGVEHGRALPERAAEGDVVVIQRDFPGDLNAYEKLRDVARRSGKPVVLDLDDLLFELPEDHPDRKTHFFTRALLPTLQALIEADLVTVATPRLRQYALRYNKNVVVLPNYFDNNLWRLRPPGHRAGGPRQLILGYMGGLTHGPDLELVVPVLLRLADRYRTRLQFHFWGMPPPEQLATLPQVRWHKRLFGNYADFAEYFQAQSADVFIAPLRDNLFNACKSHIKFFEYSALGVPGVFSRIEPYSSIIKNGKNGFLASSLEEWQAALVRLLEDPELRIAMAAGAQATIRSKWLLSENAGKWAQAYRMARTALARKAKPRSYLGGLIRSLAHETVDEHEMRRREMKRLGSQLNRKEENLQALSAEIALKEQARQTIMAELTQQRQSAETLSVQLQEKDQSARELAEQLQEAGKSAHTLREQMETKEQAVEALSAEVAKMQWQLSDLQSGIAYTVLRRYRGLVEKWMPQGTGRRGLYDSVRRGLRVLVTDGPGVFWKRLREHQRTTVKLRWLLAPLRRKVEGVGTSINPSPLISVVIPIYDRTDVLKQSIDSILNQSHRHLELILVCDGSPEATLDIVRSYERSDPRVRVFTFSNNSGNAVRGRNKAIKEARGTYLAFQDSDDIAEPDRLKHSLEAIQKYDAAVVYGGWRALVEGRKIDIRDGQEVFSPECDLETLKEICVPCQSTVMARVDCLREVGGFKEQMRYREDHELWARLAYFGYHFKSIHRVLTNLRLHPANLELAFKDKDDYWRERMQSEYMTRHRMRPKIGYVIPGTGISGGIAVVCQHTNRLLLRGYDVTILAEDNRDSIPWFPNQLCEVIPLNRAADNYDILVATGWSTAYSVKRMPAPRKFYFVQSDERRFFSKGERDVARAQETYGMDFEFMTIGRWLQKWLKDEFGKTAAYVPNGIDATIIHPAEPLAPKGRRVRVLLEGPIDIPFKGMEDAFNAVEALDCEVWCVSAAGRPKPQWKCDRFFEKVPFGEMKHIYSSCDILLKMSRVEGVPYPPLEMMACGGAVVVGAVTGIEEYLVDGQNGIIVPEGDVGAARAAVRRLIEDPALRSRLAMHGMETARNRSWDSSIDLLERQFGGPPAVSSDSPAAPLHNAIGSGPAAAHR